jgi:acyl-CoA synthetase (NDP forming)
LSQNRLVVVLKAGRTVAGSRAAGSHTAALATPDRLTKGLCRQAGIVRAQTLEEMVDVTSLLSRQPLPAGKRVAVLTNAGGPGVLCADALAAAGCEVPELSAGLQAKLRSFVPGHATVCNPIDLVASIDPQLMGDCLKCLLDSDEIDAAVVIYVPRLAGSAPDIARAIHKIGGAVRPQKTLLAVFFAAEQEVAELQQLLEPIPCFRYPESAARALALVRDQAARHMVPELSPEDDRLVTSDARTIVERFLQGCGKAGGWLEAADTQRLLSSCGLTVPAWQIADSQEMAVHAADQIGFPVVVKAVNPQLVHKSAAGGVVLDVRSSADVRDAWRVLAARFAGLTAVLLQRYMPADVEAIIGVKCEVGFGHVIGLGMGGTRAERLKGIEFRLLPLTNRDSYELVRDSPLAEICLTTSGELTACGKAVEKALMGVSTLISAVPEIVELDLNPVALFQSRDSSQVLDARVFVTPTCSVGA